MSKEHVLLTFNKDWADEFSVYGLCIMTKERWETIEAALKSIEEQEIYWSFGSNEGWDDEKVKDFLEEIEVIEVDEKEKDFLFRLLPHYDWRGRTFGHFPPLADWVEESSENITHELTKAQKYLKEDNE